MGTQGHFTQLIFSDLSTPKGRAEPKKEEAKESAEGTETEGEGAIVSLGSTAFAGIAGFSSAKKDSVSGTL